MYEETQNVTETNYFKLKNCWREKNAEDYSVAIKNHIICLSICLGLEL